jgi:thymidylate synthase (FAD)
LIKQGETVDDMYKHIEYAGRVCYASEPKEGSAKEFVDRLIKSGHGSVLEHGTIYLAIPMTTYAPEAVNIYRNNPYSKVNECNEFIFTDKYGDKVATWCITTNLRVLVENDCLEDLEFLCEPTKYHDKRITVEVNCDIGISREANRHRAFSISEQSTRYCNFSKNKFNNEVTFIEPCWSLDNFAGDLFKLALKDSEIKYLQLIESGWKPQQARNVLPLATATRVIYTAFEKDWEHFFDLRCHSNAHPQAQEIANMIKYKIYGIN